MKKIITASNNKNKVKEIKQILSDIGYDVLSLEDAKIYVEPEETADTFAGNALIKAREIAKYTDELVIADDSGLMVEALSGRPGVYSKRFAGENADDDMNNKHLISELQKYPGKSRNAKFVCVIALVYGGLELIFEGICQGIIIDTPRGNNGFGYDPYFYIPEYGKTTAQMSEEEKNMVSHRGNALSKLKIYLENNPL